jgi:hypothetical protein
VGRADAAHHATCVRTEDAEPARPLNLRGMRSPSGGTWRSDAGTVGIRRRITVPAASPLITACQCSCRICVSFASQGRGGGAGSDAACRNPRLLRLSLIDNATASAPNPSTTSLQKAWTGRSPRPMAWMRRSMIACVRRRLPQPSSRHNDRSGGRGRQEQGACAPLSFACLPSAPRLRCEARTCTTSRNCWGTRT